MRISGRLHACIKTSVLGKVRAVGQKREYELPKNKWGRFGKNRPPSRLKIKTYYCPNRSDMVLVLASQA